MIFGFKKVEGADPDMFIVTPQYTYGIDKSNIYLSGEKTEDKKLPFSEDATTFSEYVTNFCDPNVEGDYSRGLYHGDKEKLKKLCKIISDKEAGWQKK